jgi:D-beta-D-heptose 7-phosphate kinase/D-beta-D-heptose 1-phosphate adenosyltransferase
LKSCWKNESNAGQSNPRWFSGKTILIVGDIMLDEFIWGKVGRISPEAPVPVIEVLEETYRLGGSANVAANIPGARGSTGSYRRCRFRRRFERIEQLLREAGIETQGLVQNRSSDHVEVTHHREGAQTAGCPDGS